VKILSLLKLMQLKKRKIFPLIVLLAVFFIASCKKDDYVPIVGLCPVVVSSIPANGATNVPLNTIVALRFNDKMESSTITPTTFTLQGPTLVNGVISYIDTTASFAPTSTLLPNTTYTVRLSTAVKSAKGNALQTDYLSSFSTGTTLAPTVIATNPTNSTTAAANAAVTAVFSVPMDPATISTSTFTLLQGLTPVAGTVTYTGSTASFTPTNGLMAGITYTATITTGAKNLAGTPLGYNYSWSFVLKLI
jgi:hypothetical protein